MANVWTYTLISVFIVSLISFVGVFALSIKADKLKKMLTYLVSLSAGTLFGDAFLHLLPEVVEEAGFGINIALYVLLGILVFFVLEKFLHWHHHHVPHSEEVHAYAMMNIIGDGLHNFIDGLIIAASYIASVPVGIATTIAVVLHEIPQEMGDFGVLLQGKFSKSKALLFNFVTALTAVAGALIGLLISSRVENITNFIIPFAAGGFIYIAGTDLIPELHKEVNVKRSLIQFGSIALGILMMVALLALE